MLASLVPDAGAVVPIHLQELGVGVISFAEQTGPLYGTFSEFLDNEFADVFEKSEYHGRVECRRFERA